MQEKFAAAIIGMPSSAISTDRVDTWAKIASSRFINEGTPLNETIQKIAQDNDLNPNFISRVCEMANLQTHTALLPGEPEKRAAFAFPLANAKEVIAALRPGPGPKKKILSDYTCPPSGLPGGGPTMSELFGVEGGGHNGFEVPEKKKLIIMIQKRASDRKRVYDALLKSAMEVETAELAVHRHTKQAVMQGASLEKIHELACHAGNGDVTAELFPKTAQLLNKQFLVSDSALEKLAFEAPESLIDRNVPVTIVNGRNPLLSSIDALKRYRDKTYSLRSGLMQIDDELKILGQRLKELE
jgi:hypothetical protein